MVFGPGCWVGAWLAGALERWVPEASQLSVGSRWLCLGAAGQGGAVGVKAWACPAGEHEGADLCPLPPSAALLTGPSSSDISRGRLQGCSVSPGCVATAVGLVGGAEAGGPPQQRLGQAVVTAFPHRGTGAHLGANHAPCVAWGAGEGRQEAEHPGSLYPARRLRGQGQPAGSSHRAQSRTVKAGTDLGSMPAAHAHQLGQDGEMDQTELGGSAPGVEAGGQRALGVREAACVRRGPPRNSPLLPQPLLVG